MSVDIHWNTLTTGPDGEELAETVRAFIHERFQQITLPRFIRSVRVHSFDFGEVAPDVEIKDICDPLRDFYDEQEGSSQDGDSQDTVAALHSSSRASNSSPSHRYPHTAVNAGDNAGQAQSSDLSHADTRAAGLRRPPIGQDQPTGPLFSNLQTPGIAGGTSNMNYFHLPFGPGLSGTATPLAAVAGAHFHSGWPDSSNSVLFTPLPGEQHGFKSITSLAPTSTADPSSRPQSQHQGSMAGEDAPSAFDQFPPSGYPGSEELYLSDSDPNDIQIVAHVKYAGDLRLSLTAEILLDYPMPSFVGIPLQLNVTGLRFDGIAILAYIKKRAHVCFLSPEDAEAYMDRGTMADDIVNEHGQQHAQFGGLLEEIKVESEIGERENGKQVLKNVGKVEKFILEQVRRIFEDEFVYPSFWTFLV